MCTFRLKTLNGEPLRNVYKDFEIRAAKFAVDSNLENDELFAFGNDGENFRVIEHSDTYIKVLRVKNNNYLEFYKVLKVEDETTPAKPVKVVKHDAATVPAAVPVVAPVTANNGNDMTAKIMAALTPAIAAAVGAAIPAPAAPAIDVDSVNAIIDGRIAPVAADMVSIKDSIKNLCVRHDIVINNAPVVHVDGVLHPAFNDVLIDAKNGIPSYLFGPAGTGKNVLAEQIAKALGVQFYYCGCLQNKYELEGFIAADGTYQETEFYKAFVDGGVFFFDEMDGTAAEVLIAFNAALANGYYNFPKFGRIYAHIDTVFIAAGNTNLHGATDAYCGRYQIDSSTIDRFGIHEMDYSREIELANCKNDSDLVDFAHDLRKAIEKQNLTYTVSPRALKRISVYLANNMSTEKALKIGMCGSWAAADVKLLASNITTTNKYAKAFMDVAR